MLGVLGWAAFLTLLLLLSQFFLNCLAGIKFRSGHYKNLLSWCHFFKFECKKVLIALIAVLLTLIIIITTTVIIMMITIIFVIYSIPCHFRLQGCTWLTLLFFFNAFLNTLLTLAFSLNYQSTEVKPHRADGATAECHEVRSRYAAISLTCMNIALHRVATCIQAVWEADQTVLFFPFVFFLWAASVLWATNPLEAPHVLDTLSGLRVCRTTLNSSCQKRTETGQCVCVSEKH